MRLGKWKGGLLCVWFLCCQNPPSPTDDPPFPVTQSQPRGSNSETPPSSTEEKKTQNSPSPLHTSPRAPMVKSENTENIPPATTSSELAIPPSPFFNSEGDLIRQGTSITHNFEPHLDWANTLEKRILGVRRYTVGKKILMGRWNNKESPLFTLNRHHSVSDQYSNWIEQVISHFNAVAIEENITSRTEKLIEYDPKISSSNPGDKNVKMVFFAPYTKKVLSKEDKITRMITFIAANANTGEMTDADILVIEGQYQEIIENKTRHLKMPQKKLAQEKKIFQTYFSHELLHALGATHNFKGKKYKSLIDYPDKSYNFYLANDSYDYQRQLRKPIPERKDYDRILLRYLYNDADYEARDNLKIFPFEFSDK